MTAIDRPSNPEGALHREPSPPGVSGDTFDALLRASAGLIDARTTGELIEAVADWAAAATGWHVSIRLTADPLDRFDAPRSDVGELVRVMVPIGPDEVRRLDGMTVTGFTVNGRPGGWVVAHGSAATDEHVDQLRALARLTGRGLERLHSHEALRGLVEELTAAGLRLGADARAADQKFRSVFNQANHFMAILDVDGKVVGANHFAARLGLDPVPNAGQALWDHGLWSATPGQGQAVRAMVEQVARGQKARGELYVRGSSGGARTLRYESSPVLDGEGRVTLVLISAIDVTDEKDVQAQLVQAIHELDVARRVAEAAAHTKAAFVASLSHEVRTSLNAIVGMADLLDGDALEPDDWERIEIIRASSAHLVSLLDEVLDLSRLEAGHERLVEGPFAVRELLDECVSLIAPSVDSSRVELIADVDDDVPYRVIADAGRLRQIILNLLTNAAKFTTSGMIQIGASIDQVETSSMELQLCVRDTGIGMPADKLNELLEPFTRAGDGPSPGVGLGLSIVRQLVELMDGSIDIECERGRGSAVRVTVAVSPVTSDDDHPDTPRQTEMDAELAPRSLHVLVADDDRLNRRVIEAMLARLGHECAVAPDGRAAVAMLTSTHYDVVLLDLFMPGLDGMATIREIRNRPAPAHLPVLGLTADASESTRRRCIQAGFDGVITKPFRLDVLRAAIDDVAGLEERNQAD